MGPAHWGLMVSAQALRELADTDPAVYAQASRLSARDRDRMYPKPSGMDVLELRNDLRAQFIFFHGEEDAAENVSSAQYDSGMDSIRSIRSVRYGQDEAPKKLRDRLAYGYRVRCMATNNEIDSVVALLGRNDPMFTVPPSGTSEKDNDRAEGQTRWLQNLIPALERSQRRSIVSPTDDALVEDAVIAGEIYLTDAWDHIDEEPRAGEDDKTFEERVRRERRRAGLPFGLRPIDPLSLYFDDPSGEGRYERAIIYEQKRYRQVYETVRRTVSTEQFEELALPEPRSNGVPYGAFGVGVVGNFVETIRYYDPRWYIYMVGDKVITCEEHGMPFCPVVIEIGDETSASTFPAKFHGITWGRASIERATNDLLTVGLDSETTYGRPMPIFTNPEGQAQALNGEPVVLNVTPGLLLPEGYDIKDAFAGFKNQGTTEGMAGMLLELFKSGGMSGVSQGKAPGADVAGYTVNLLMSADLAKYKGLIKAKCRFWQHVGDAVRLLVRDTIGDTVELAAPMSEGGDVGTQWLALSPDNVDETPCIVTEDPLDNQNRISQSQWLLQGMQAALVTEERVMRDGYGVTDIAAERAEIDRDAARRALRPLRIQQALAEVQSEDQAAQPPPVLVGPTGEPITSKSMQASGALPADLHPPTVGAGGVDQPDSPLNYRTAIAGQQPPGRGGSPRAGESPF